jgi:hypothetical protein
MTTRPTAKSKVLSLARLLVLLVFGVWLIWGFNGGTSDEAKYKRLQGLARTRSRLNSVDQWLPPRASKFIHLSELEHRETLKYELLRIELLTCGYLTNITFVVTNPAMTGPRIETEFAKAFKPGDGPLESRVWIPQTASGGAWDMVAVTCRPQDVVVYGRIVSGDSNAPAKPLNQFRTLYEGDMPGGGDGF